MPGVKASDLEIDLRENILTLTGRVTVAETSKESSVLREYRPGTFFRRFQLSETIDQPKIDAQLTDGVLRLELPKVEKARPRQITVRPAWPPSNAKTETQNPEWLKGGERMWWECSECGAHLDRPSKPTVCSECGVAGGFFVRADPDELATSASDGDSLRTAWFRVGLDQPELMGSA
jgi:hypothetical protein